MKEIIKVSTERQVTLEGMMNLGLLENGLHTADFMCCEDAQVEPFTGKCKVQLMRDGNVYITELKKRIRNKALFRDDNCSLSHGRDGRWYFCFSLDGDELPLLPQKLIRQASNIAQKMLKKMVLLEKEDWKPFGLDW